MASTGLGKGIALVGFTVLALVPLGVAAAHGRGDDSDWSRKAANIAGSLPAMLGYQPTDGASYGGQVRRAMDPARVRPH